MSLGGHCRKICEDKENALYEYHSYNWDNKNNSSKKLYDGTIKFNKNSLDNTSKSISILIKEKTIEITNCSNTYEKNNYGIDKIAIMLSDKIYSAYKLKSNFLLAISLIG